MTKSVKRTGRVVARRVAERSKSDREAICLETADGCFVLRRQGGHPFHDPVLRGLEGKCIRVRGRLRHQTLIISDWDEVETEEEPEG